ADDAVQEFFTAVGREDDFIPLLADQGATYDVEEHIDLSTVEPLIAMPSSPGNVVPVREAAGEEVFQVVVGSSANPGLRDFAVVAEILTGQQSHEQVSLDINPSSRGSLMRLTTGGWAFELIGSGARLHQSACMGCSGMGQAPAVGGNSLRTMPQNFRGRSGADEDAVWLCSPETAAAAALTGKITDPRELDMDYPRVELPEVYSVNTDMLLPPLDEAEAQQVDLVKGTNIVSLPEFDELPDDIDVPVLLRVGDD